MFSIVRFFDVLVFTFINMYYLGRRLRDWKKILSFKISFFNVLVFTFINTIWVDDSGTGKNFFYLKIEADIRHFVFFTHAECALKMFYAC
jgi:hypothetical protein